MKKIGKIVGSNYRVTAQNGHYRTHFSFDVFCDTKKRILTESGVMAVIEEGCNLIDENGLEIPFHYEESYMILS